MNDEGISSIHERLAEGRDRLERLDRERSWSGNPLLGKAIEQRIVWRELLDLELQDFDDQIERTCATARNISGCWPAPPAQNRTEPT
jgi:hypothetical protein